MIIDTLDNLGKYVGLNPLFADVMEFLKQNDLSTMDEGKHPIKGADLFVRMIDIQLPLDADETFGYSPVCDLPDYEYNPEKDMTKYGDTPSQTYVTVKPGQMAIFFPQDGHAPCISEKEVIKKAIFKVKA